MSALFCGCACLKSGVHATLAGVALAQTIPLESMHEPGYSPLKYLEHKLHSFVVYVVLPVFAFANAGVSLSEFGMNELFHPFLWDCYGVIFWEAIWYFCFCLRCGQNEVM